MDPFKRKTPEEILSSIHKLQQGRLKIYIGAVSGSGKTYHMLREGQALQEQGIDVVICAVSTKQRPETMEQLAGLERVPSLHWHRHGVEQKDLNLEALLLRNPEVVLVDGLAHRNRPRAEHKTRLEDIKLLLARGISVITTVNVYELEGVTEAAKKLAGISVKETVPDDTLALADEVQLVDVTPETLLQRLSDGHLRNHTELHHFKHGNLSILRELALRLVAEGVNESLEKYREELGLIGPSGAAERILVSTQYHWNGSIYVRRGQQVARRLNGDLMVVVFTKAHKKLTKEQQVFKQSMKKLVSKVGGTLEELSIVSRRELSWRLVHYALSHNVTRIVLGHSKQTRWQELWQGSLVYEILRKMKNIDVFIMADRAAQEGERILPARVAGKETPLQEAKGKAYHRLSSHEVDEKIGRIKRGTFKVYIGAAPGVGKTYTMLREGNMLLKKGVRVEIGLLETHGRKETAKQVGNLPIIPKQQIRYQARVLEEMDTEAIIASNPDVVLVDELAHTNMPGSKHKKRYEDVIELLDAGISIIATVNVQHLESLNDAVEQMTGVRVRETIPDFILRLADEVELIDVTPEALRQRMREGQIYAMEKVNQALNHFFTSGNLIALRELALRELADDVDERLEAWEQRSSLRGPWRRKEVIFVCVDTSEQAERLIRRGFRIAHRLKAEWIVLHVLDSSSHHAAMASEYRKKLEALESLTVRLGGRFEQVSLEPNRHVAEKLILMAKEAEATQLVIGQSKCSIWERLRRGSIMKTILREARHMDVLVVSRYDPHVKLEPSS
ncbi:universal stress protein [Paenibacillus aquistagni]|uniref:Two-component system, OmpR family, sensor histidine kinase KdpD n=1 Tax=Paenibacillus aquistagni TaxID=1852522 RepID=A0A1X7LAN0_9BACL|nr:universal stress protein [Paenibacillus aquistagni]SMG50891.1 two-component system, OmpR family, sensor histidine kinase KdpD [Paenibacillus aquistagni]